jgi:hypothetical protein
MYLDTCTCAWLPAVMFDKNHTASCKIDITVKYNNLNHSTDNDQTFSLGITWIDKLSSQKPATFF